MNIKIKLSILFVLILAMLFSVRSVSASTVQLSGNISSAQGGSIAGAIIDIFTPGTTNNVASTTSDDSGNYNTSLNDGVYDIRVIPPAASNFNSAIAQSYIISTNAVLNFILVSQGTSTLSGHIYDSFGNPAADQVVNIFPSTSTTTDASGAYSLQVTPGAYTIEIRSPFSNNDLSSNLSQYYSIIVQNYSLSVSKILDVTLPLKRVVLHTQNASGNIVAGVAITAQGSTSNLSIGGGITNASATSRYGTTGPAPVTDASGNTTLWLLPINATFTATPPSGSVYSQTNLSASITADINLTITMQQPVILSGHIYDPLGNPAAGQSVNIFPSTSTTTDVSGAYSLQVTPGTYTIEIHSPYSGGNSPPSNLPQFYSIIAQNFSLSQDRVLDVAIPAKRVNIHIQSALGDSLGGISISTRASGGISIGGGINASGDSGYGMVASAPVTDSSGNVTLWLLPASFTFTATPQSGSIYSQTTLSASISSDTNLNITMQQQSAILSGHIYDSSGNPVSDQVVNIFPSTSTTTDTLGSYSLRVPVGTYTIEIRSPFSGNDLTTNLSQYYSIIVQNYSLSVSKILDVTLPLKRVVIHVQNASNDPVGGISISADGSGSISIGGGINASDRSAYGTNGQGSTFGPAPLTDSSGNVTLWLLPASFNFIARPPSGSIYNTFTFNSSITSDTTEIISLQFVHDRPVTVATLSPVADSSGNYSDPTTVTLSATAASGFSIAATYYTIDGGPTQNYSTPFTVSGSGNHTVTFWSVDNVGIPELPNSLSFTIAPLVITTVSLPDTSVGATYSETLQATGGTTPYAWSVVSGFGSLPAGLNLNSLTGEISGTPTTVETVNFTVQVTDANNNTATKNLSITVHGNTSVGTNVSVGPLNGVTLEFSEVTSEGQTTVTTSGTGQPPPTGFKLGNPPTYYSISTTATFTGTVEVCISWTEGQFNNENNLKLWHFNGTNWVDVTTSLDTVNNVICGTTSSFSDFAIFEKKQVLATIDIKPGSYPNSINLGSNGVVPIAIFSTSTFDARTIDPTTVTLASAPVNLKGNGTLQFSFQDVNGDGLLDLVVQVSTQALQLSSTDQTADLVGYTLDNTEVIGSDTIRVVQ